MASSVTPYGMPLIVAQRRPFTPTSGGKDWGSRLQERRECADVVNKIRPRAACKAALKGKWRDTTMHLIFPQSPGATEIQRGTGCSTAFFFFFFSAQHPCSLSSDNTTLVFLRTNAVPPSPPSGSEKADVSPPPPQGGAITEVGPITAPSASGPH